MQTTPESCDMCKKPFGEHPTEHILYKKHYLRNSQLCQFCQPFLRNPACCRTCFATQWSSTQLFHRHLSDHRDHISPAWTECPICHLNWTKLPTQSQTPNQTTTIILPEIFTNPRAQDHHVRSCLINYLTNPDNYPSNLPVPHHLEEKFPYLVNHFEEVLNNLGIDPEKYHTQLQSHRNQLTRLKRKREFNSIPHFIHTPISRSPTNTPIPSQQAQSNPQTHPQTQPQTHPQTHPQTKIEPFEFKEFYKQLEEIAETREDPYSYDSDDMVDLLQKSMKRMKVSV